MKIAYIFTLFALIFNVYFAIAQELDWAKAMGGQQLDQGTSISIDNWGNVYTTGNFSGTADMQPGSGTHYMTSIGSFDAFVTKIGSNGDFKWTKQFGGTHGTMGQSLFIDKVGDIYITGYFTGTTDFDPGPGTVNLTSHGNEDIFITKLDSSGNLIWARHVGGSGIDYGQSIVVDSAGNVYVTGMFSGTVDFDPGFGTHNVISSGGFDIFILKLNVSGDFVWVKQFGGTSNCFGLGITLDGSGNILATGSFSGTADFDPGTGTYNLTSNGLTDCFIMRLNSFGDFEWAKRIGGSGNDAGRSIVIDPSGSIFCIGRYSNTVDFDPGPGTFNLTSVGGTDIFILKLDSLGDFVLAKSMGGPSDDIGNSLVIDTFGHLYLTGYYQGTADFDPGLGVYTLISAGDRDVFVTKLDSSGNFLWAGSMGGPGWDGGASITLDPIDNIYVTGYFESVADFNPGAGTLQLTSHGQHDIYILKLKQCIAPILAVTSSTILCNGETSVITVSDSSGQSNLSYLWNTGHSSPSISGIVAGTYSVTVSTATNCLDSISITVIEPLAISGIPYSSSSQSFPNCTGVAALSTLGGTPPYSFTWSNGSFDSSITNVCAGTYYVTIVDGNGCSYEDSVVVTQVTGIIDDPIKPLVRVYPNPSYGQFTIEIQDLHLIDEMKLIDLLGRELIYWGNGDLNSNTIQVSLSGEPKGNYLLEIRSRETVYVVKLGYQ